MKFDIKNLSDEVVELYFYGEIVSSELDAWDYDSQFPSSVRDFLVDNKGKEVHVKINSPGGDCFAGICIGEMLKQHEGKTIAFVDGLSASISTYIASCCDEVRIHENSYWMIHNAWCCAMGNKKDLQETIDILEKMDNSIAQVYMKHTNKSLEEIQEMMDNETWLVGNEILDVFNFDLEEGKIRAYAKLTDEMMNRYKNVPKDLLSTEEEVEENEEQEEEEQETETEVEEEQQETEEQEEEQQETETEVEEEQMEDECKKKEEQAKAKKELELINKKEKFLQAKAFLDKYND